MALCAWGEAWQWSLGAHAATHAHYVLGVVPAVLAGQASLPPGLHPLFAPLTLFTAPLLHAGLPLLALNLALLWLFAAPFEQGHGHVRCAVVLSAGAVCAELAQVFVDPLATQPIVGAAGAVAATLGAALLPGARLPAMPLATHRLHATLDRHPALLPLSAWLMLLVAAGTPGAAWSGLLAGLVSGLALGLFLVDTAPRAAIRA